MRSLNTRAAGLFILVLGIWGGLVPFVGSYFHFALGPDKSWSWTVGRLYLDILPGIAAVLGGLMLLGAGPRPSGRLGALLALAGGIWFAIGPEMSQLWNAAGAQGAAHGSRGIRMLEMLTYHTGLGVLVAALASYALPRGVVAPAAAPAEPAPAAVAPAAPDEAYPGEVPVAAGGPQHAGTTGPQYAGATGQQYAGTTQAAERSQPYEDRAHVRSRRRGGLLSVFSRR